MKKLLLSLLIPAFSFAQDTIQTTAGKTYAGKITLDNGEYIFLTTKKGFEESINKSNINFYYQEGKRTYVNNHKGFSWDVIIDSLDNDKAALYTATKFFISEYWNSAKAVMQDDDREGGIIVIKPISKIEKYYQLNDHTWVFGYQVTFMIKDKKCRIVINGVKCEDARAGKENVPWPDLPVSETFPGYSVTSVSEERYADIMRELKYNMGSIVKSYTEAVKKGKKLSDW